MTFAAALDVIEAHAQTAGATLTPALIGRIGHPVPKGRCFRIFYDGDSEPSRAGGQRTLSNEMIGERVMVVAFWPLSTNAEDFAENVEAEVRAFNLAFKTALFADSQLGGNCDDLDVGYAETDFVQAAGGTFRTLEISLTLDFLSDYPIAP